MGSYGYIQQSSISGGVIWVCLRQDPWQLLWPCPIITVFTTIGSQHGCWKISIITKLQTYQHMCLAKLGTNMHLDSSLAPLLNHVRYTMYYVVRLHNTWLGVGTCHKHPKGSNTPQGGCSSPTMLQKIGTCATEGAQIRPLSSWWRISCLCLQLAGISTVEIRDVLLFQCLILDVLTFFWMLDKGLPLSTVATYCIWQPYPPGILPIFLPCVSWQESTGWDWQIIPGFPHVI